MWLCEMPGSYYHRVRQANGWFVRMTTENGDRIATNYRTYVSRLEYTLLSFVPTALYVALVTPAQEPRAPTAVDRAAKDFKSLDYTVSVSERILWQSMRSNVYTFKKQQ